MLRASSNVAAGSNTEVAAETPEGMRCIGSGFRIRRPWTKSKDDSLNTMIGYSEVRVERFLSACAPSADEVIERERLFAALAHGSSCEGFRMPAALMT